MPGREGGRLERKREKVDDVLPIVEDVTIMGDVENNITNSGELKLENISPGMQGKEAREGQKIFIFKNSFSLLKFFTAISTFMVIY